MSTLAIVFPFVFLLFFILPISIGIYVYRDAKKRGMNALLWLLISILAPALVGFILYLLVRTNYSDLQCPQCKNRVKEDYVSCPHCGTQFKAVCPSCSFPVEKDWKVCPRCTQPLSSANTELAVPVREKDRTLHKLILAIVVIPLVILLFFIIFSVSSFSSVGSSAGVTSLPINEYLDEIDHYEPIEQWLTEEKDDSNKAYILCYSDENDDSDNPEYQYLIYWPQMADMPSLSIHPSSGFFENTTEISILPDGSNLGNTVLIVHSSDEKIRLYDGDNAIECEIINVSFPVELPA